MDVRWCYASLVPSLWNRPRPDLIEQSFTGNKFIITRFNVDTSEEGSPMLYNTGLFDKQTINRNPGAIPFSIA